MLKNSNQIFFRQSRHNFCWVKLIACIFFPFLLFFGFLKSFSLLLYLNRPDLLNFYLHTFCELSFLFFNIFNDFLNCQNGKPICSSQIFCDFRFSCNWRAINNNFIRLKASIIVEFRNDGFEIFQYAFFRMPLT